MSTKSIKISLENYDAFQVMTPAKVKKVILGLMDAADGRCATGMTKDIYPIFVKLREQLEVDGEGTPGDGKWHDGLDELIKAHDEKLAFYEQRRKTIREEHKSFGKEYKALGKRRDALEEEYRALKEKLDACNGDDTERFRGEYEALEKRRKAIGEGYESLRKRGMGYLMENIINLEKECSVLKEENKLLKGGRADFDTEWKPIDQESSKEDTVADLPQMSDDANGGGCVVSKEGVVLTQEAWKVIDENWEELKKAVYKIKVKNETTPYVRLPMEGWKVLDRYFDELVKLFHL